VSADGTDLPDNKCFDVTTSYGQCESECKDEKLSNGANWLCYQDAKNQAIWGGDTYWKKLLGANSVGCDSTKNDDDKKQCTTLDLLKENADGEALAKATGFCPGKEPNEPTNTQLVNWFFDCDKYPFDEELSLLEYARCMKEPDCPEKNADEKEDEEENIIIENNTEENKTEENNNIEKNNNIENNEKEDGKPFFTSDQIYDMLMAGATMEQIKEIAQYG
jgi:hypothetical protein